MDLRSTIKKSSLTVVAVCFSTCTDSRIQPKRFFYRLIARSQWWLLSAQNRDLYHHFFRHLKSLQVPHIFRRDGDLLMMMFLSFTAMKENWKFLKMLIGPWENWKRNTSRSLLNDCVGHEPHNRHTLQHDILLSFLCPQLKFRESDRWMIVPWVLVQKRNELLVYWEKRGREFCFC